MQKINYIIKTGTQSWVPVCSFVVDLSVLYIKDFMTFGKTLFAIRLIKNKAIFSESFSLFGL